MAKRVTFSTVCFGSTRSSTGTIPTDKKFTGQRLDSTGLYYYNARYYDPTIGRFISPDIIVPHPTNPQSLNRYSYCLNNPLKYIDPTGLITQEELNSIGIYEKDMHYSMWSLLRAADIGDKVVIDDQEYYFYHEAQYYYDSGTLRMLTSNSNFVDIIDILGDTHIGKQKIKLYEWNTTSRMQLLPEVKWIGHWTEKRFSHIKPIEINMDWEGLGRGALGAAEIAGGSIVASLGLVVSTSGVVSGAWPAAYPGAAVTTWGWDLIATGVETASSGNKSLPQLDPYTKYMLFRNTGMIDIFKYMLGQ